MLSPRSLLCVFLTLCLCLDATVANRYAVRQRDESTSMSITAAPASTNTASSIASAKASSPANIADPKTNNDSSSTSTVSASVTIVTGASVIATSNSPIYTGYFFNSTLNPDELPIDPKLTPAFAVGGVILIVTGAVYALIGIKNVRLQVGLSAAYLSSLATAVLILYVMNVPVSNGVQGAYFVAIVMTGLILGGAATVLPDMTEGLGALLGGFCLAMWLLCLSPGGLFHTTSSIATFISCFTVVAYATTFSHFTRPYALIGGISLGGATVAVLGIDCFSRAGLKEFWAYIWNLNVNLFPLGADTYPITRGMKVELAAIVVIFLAGVISQVKLWKLIKERKAKRNADQKDLEEKLQHEDEIAGKRVEEEIAREHGDWEAAYGGGEAPQSSGSAFSKNSAQSAATAVESTKDDMEVVEAPSSNTSGSGVKEPQNPVTITVRVVEEDLPTPSKEKTEATEVSDMLNVSAMGDQTKDDELRTTVENVQFKPAPPRRNSQRIYAQQFAVPEVVPLPFNVPVDDTKSNRSSVATFNDDAGDHRLSHGDSGSVVVRRNLSTRSNLSVHRTSSNAAVEDVLAQQEITKDDSSSIAATMDDLSDDEFSRHDGDVELELQETQLPTPTNDERRLSSVAGDDNGSDDSGVEIAKDGGEYVELVTLKSAETTATIALATNDTVTPEATAQKSSTSSTDPCTVGESVIEMDEFANKSSDVASSTSKQLAQERAILSKEALPTAMSKVGMRYRTNEWAKHLSHADSPQLEELARDVSLQEETEVPAPVNVVELQQTAGNAPIAPATRSKPTPIQRQPLPTSQPSASRPHVEATVSRSVSFVHAPNGHIFDPSSCVRPQEHTLERSLTRSSSIPSLTLTTSTTINPGDEPPSSQTYNLPLTPSSSSSYFPSPSYPANTLMAKRDTIIRSKTNPIMNVGNFPTYAPNLTTTPEGSVVNAGQESLLEDDNLSLSDRRSIIQQMSRERERESRYLQQQQQSSLYQPTQPFSPSSPTGQQLPYASQQGSAARNSSNGRQSYRQSSVPSAAHRESQLSNFRQSVQLDLRQGGQARKEVERSRSMMILERMETERERADEKRQRQELELERDRAVRAGRGVTDRHREAMRKMQGKVKLESV